MPQRPRQHQLEERSRAEFRRRLPDHFVVRDKGSDYGVDLELEIFDREHRATGLVANIQIKATDDIARRRQLRLSVAQRNYLRSLPARALIVLWCAADDSLHWGWLDWAREPEPYRDTQTITFDDSHCWTEASADAIEVALRDWRRIADHPQGAPVHLTIDVGDYPAAYRQPFLTAVRSLVAETGALSLAPAGDRFVLALEASDGKIRLSAGSVAYMEVDHDGAPDDRLAVLLRYMLTAALHRLPLARHADTLARQCLAVGATAPNAELGLWAMRALSASAEQSIRLALLNNLHEADLAPFLVMRHLDDAPFEREDRNAAKRAFLEACIAANSVQSRPGAVGALYYTLGNHCAHSHDMPSAVRAFNRARKYRPAYATSGYFLSELAGALFGAAKFELSARIYRQAVAIEPSAYLALCLGDALLFSGQFAEAEASFERALDEGGAKIAAEAQVKSQVCGWLIDRHGVTARLSRSAAGHLHRDPPDEEAEADILARLDPLDDIAHWNSGIRLANRRAYSDAMIHFLLCAFRRSGDQEAWMNACLCALNGEDPYALQSIMGCALAQGGPTACDMFADRLAGAPDVVEGIHKTIEAFNTDFHADARQSPTIRILSSDGALDGKSANIASRV